jgi:very-short-patch-repair endonuclease
MRRPPGEEPLLRIRGMRHAGTEPEKRLWAALRNRQIAGAKFRRQIWIGRYIVDFVCADARLIVEVDGDTHGDPSADTVRTSALSACGFRVVRVANHDVMRNLEGVIAMIEQALTLPLGCAGRVPPSPLKGEGK